MKKIFAFFGGASLLLAGACETSDPMMTEPSMEVSSPAPSYGGSAALTKGGIADFSPPAAVPLTQQPAKKYLGHIYFDFDKDVIRASQVPRLEQNIAFLNANPSVKVSIHGYADYFSSDDYNMKLSQRRVKRVHDYLIEHGVNADQVMIDHHGEKDRLDEFAEGFYTDRRRRVQFEFVQ